MHLSWTLKATKEENRSNAQKAPQSLNNIAPQSLNKRDWFKMDIYEERNDSENRKLKETL